MSCHSTSDFFMLSRNSLFILRLPVVIHNVELINAIDSVKFHLFKVQIFNFTFKSMVDCFQHCFVNNVIPIQRYCCCQKLEHVYNVRVRLFSPSGETGNGGEGGSYSGKKESSREIEQTMAGCLWLFQSFNNGNASPLTISLFVEFSVMSQINK